MKLLLSEKDKYKKDKENLKKIVEHYEVIGEKQVSRKEDKIRRLYNLANGVLNPSDYVEYEEEKDMLFGKEVKIEDLGLMFYPIIPNIIKGILGEFDKRWSEHTVRAVNEENTNEILDAMTEQLQTMFVEQLQAKFEGNEEGFDAAMESDKVRNFFLTNYRTTIEEWAVHQMNLDRERLDIKELERQMLTQILVTEDPIVHVNYLDGNYTVENIEEINFFYIKPPHKEDYSESMMAGWFKYSSVSSILNAYSTLMSEDDMEKVIGWTSDITGTDFVVNNVVYTGNRTGPHESRQNLIAFKKMYTGLERRFDDEDGDLIRETHMYFLLPRKIGKLTTVVDGQRYAIDVSEEFRVTQPGVYDGKRTVENLVSGQHVDWFFINELFRCIKLDVGHRAWAYDTKNEDEKTLWLLLDKHPIQYSMSNHRYGVRIPVHGGQTTNKYSLAVSPTEQAAPTQIMYNWLYNRSQQLLATEVGKFIILNQNLIPQESFDGSWGKNNLMKFFMVAHDASIAPVDPSITNMGQSANQVSGGFGQVVDLTKTEEVLGKLSLAAQVKMECYQQFGVTQEFLFGNFSPSQTSTSVAQGMQRSITQIQYFYNRLDRVLQYMWETILETAQYLASVQDSVQISYQTSDGARMIFRSNTDGFLVHKLGIFVKNSGSDQETLERIKQIATQSNTFGADSLELATIMAARTIPDIFKDLREIQAKREAEQRRQEEAENKRVQAQIESTERMKQADLDLENQKHQDLIEADILTSQIKALGYGNSPVEDIAVQIEKLTLDRDRFDEANKARDMVNDLKERALSQKTQQTEEARLLQEKIKMRELELKEKDIMARNKRSNAIASRK